MNGGPEPRSPAHVSPERADIELPCAVILAAGASSRLGEPKALAHIGRRRVVDRIRATLGEHLVRSIDAMKLRPAHPTLVVTGAHDERIRDHLRRMAAREEVLFNPRWESGRTSSVQAAVLARPGSALLIWPADVPLVTGATVRLLVSKWDELGAPAEGWIAPRCVASRTEVPGSEKSCRQAFGHPILIGHALALKALQMAPQKPLRELRRLASPLAAVDVDDLAVLDDLDTPADLAALSRRIAASEG